MRYKMTNRGKIVIFLLVICLCFGLFKFCGRKKHDSVPVNNNVITATQPTTTTTTTSPIITTEPATLPPVRITGCSSAALYCPEKNQFLLSQDMENHVAPASLTKLLSACTALKYLSPDTICTVGTEQYLVMSGSSLCYLNMGQQITVRDLITGMLMASGNDAAHTLAVTTARSVFSDQELTDNEAVEKFCQLMNNFAADLGMTNSHFTTPDGWDSDGQYTTAADLVILARYAMTVPEIREPAGCAEKTVVIASGENFLWHNSNQLLHPESPYYSSNAYGLKTGSTINAGNCLISAFQVQGLTYIAVVTGCENDTDRYEITLRIINDLT